MLLTTFSPRLAAAGSQNQSVDVCLYDIVCSPLAGLLIHCFVGQLILVIVHARWGEGVWWNCGLGS